MRVRGNTVGFPNPQPDWEQTDTNQADYIKNKPELPITINEDGYTDISGLRQMTDVKMVKSENVITVTATLEGDVPTTSVITLDDYGYPVSINTDGTECTVNWEGFE